MMLNNVKTNADLTDMDISKKYALAISFLLFFLFPALMIFKTRMAPGVILLAGIIAIISLYQNGKFKDNLKFIFKFPKFEFTLGSLLRLSLWLAIIWVSLSYLWTDNMPKAIRHGTSATCLIILSYLIYQPLKTIHHSIHLKFAVWGFLTLAFFLWIELIFQLNIRAYIEETPLSALNRSSILLIFLLWPILFAIPKNNNINWLFCLCLWLITGLVTFNSESQSATAGFLMSSLILPFLFIIRPFPILLGLLTALAIITTPIIMDFLIDFQNQLPTELSFASARHRLVIWEFYNMRLFDHFLFGHGIEGHASLVKSQTYADFATTAGFASKASHPHNASLEIWIDLGLIGAIITASILCLCCFSFMQFSKNTQRGLCLLVIAILTASSFAYELLETWWYSTMIIAILFALSQNRAINADT